MGLYLIVAVCIYVVFFLGLSTEWKRECFVGSYWTN